MAEKIFIGKVEVKETQWGEIIKIAFSPEDKKKLEQYSNGKGWVNISILNSQKGGKYATIDTYGTSTDKSKFEPEPQVRSFNAYGTDETDVDSIPF